MINLSVNLEGATVQDLQTFLRAVESTGTKGRTPLELDGTVLSVKAEYGATGASTSATMPKIDGDKPLGDQALKSVIDALVNRATGN